MCLAFDLPARSRYEIFADVCSMIHFLRKQKRSGTVKNSIVVYTAIYGGCDGLLPQKKCKGVDYICFSDREMHASPWDVRVMEAKGPDPVRCAKEYKILPHRFFPEYEYSIWIDGNYLIVGDLYKLLSEVLKIENMAVFDHNETYGDNRNCLYKEYESILRLGRETGCYKDDPEIMKKQIARYRSEAYPENNGLIFASILIRRHNKEAVKEAMELWWREIENGSRRDQLSFNYVAWKSGLNMHVIKENIRDNRWFYMIGIHRSDYRMKLFHYRLKRLFGLRRHH